MHWLLNIIRRFLLFLVGFTLPLTGAWTLDLGVPASPFKIVSAVLMVYSVFLFAVTGRMPRRDAKAWWVLGFAASYGVSCFYSILSGLPASTLAIPVMSVSSLILFYFTINYVILARRDLVLFLWAFVVGSAVSATPAVLGIQGGMEVPQGERFEGLSQQVNVFGFDMMVALPIAVALFIKTHSLIGRLVVGGATMLASGGLLLSLSRAAFVSAISEYALWVYRYGRLDSIKYLIPAAALGVGVVLMAPDAVQRRIESMTDPAQRAADGSIQARFRQFEVSMTAIAQNPLLGVGTRRFIMWSQENPGIPNVHHMVHNAYLRVGVEQGLIGVVLFVGIIGITWRQYTRAWRTARARRELRDVELAELGHYAMFLQIALFGGLVGSIFTHSQDSKSFWVLLALGTIVRDLVQVRVRNLGSASSESQRVPAEWSAEAPVSDHLGARA